MSKKTDIETNKTSGDVVFQEMWRVKDKLSEAYGHDVGRLFAEARERPKHSDHPVMNLQTRLGKA